MALISHIKTRTELERKPCMEFLEKERGRQYEKSSKVRRKTNALDLEVRFFGVTFGRAVSVFTCVSMCMSVLVGLGR